MSPAYDCLILRNPYISIISLHANFTFFIFSRSHDFLKIKLTKSSFVINEENRYHNW